MTSLAQDLNLSLLHMFTKALLYLEAQIVIEIFSICEHCPCRVSDKLTELDLVCFICLKAHSGSLGPDHLSIQFYRDIGLVSSYIYLCCILNKSVCGHGKPCRHRSV